MLLCNTIKVTMSCMINNYKLFVEASNDVLWALIEKVNVILHGISWARPILALNGKFVIIMSPAINLFNY